MPSFLATLLRGLIVWITIMAAESVHGALRRVLLSPEVGFAIHALSIVIALAIVFGLTWIFMSWIRLRTTSAALGLGAVWATLTLGFEIALGRITGISWDRIWADYDLTRGGLMGPGLLAMALTPWAVRELKARSLDRGRDAGSDTPGSAT